MKPLGRMLLLCLAFLVSMLPLHLKAQMESDIPFEAGENLNYNVYIKGIYCGSQVLSVIGREEWDGREVYHIQVKTDTASIVNMFLNYHEVLDLYLDAYELYPLRSHTVASNKQKREVTDVIFSPDGTVYKTERKEGKTEQFMYTGPPKVQEGLSLFYFLRIWPWENGYDLQFAYMSSRGHITNVNIKDPCKDTIDTKSGRYDCYYLNDPAIPCSFWISSKKPRIPVRIFNERPFGIIESRLMKAD
ncbi:MAG: DUF3108 domain-containing protein [Bacillota bacterium]